MQEDSKVEVVEPTDGTPSDDMGYTEDAGFGYTLATGRLFIPIASFHEKAEVLMGRPIFTHEFGSKEMWAEMREAFEQEALETIP